jgi:hypothetical protein
MDRVALWAKQRLATIELEFNRLFVHSSMHPYSIEPASRSSSILDATVFLDGYLW